MDRDPCPQRIWGDLGGAYAMGCLGGGLWHLIKGSYASRRGYKFIGGLSAMRKRAPVLGGNFAIWGGLFSTFDCLIAHGRGREDLANPILAGAVTGAVLSARAGIRASTRSGIIGGVLLIFIEGAAHFLQVYSEKQQHEAFDQIPGASAPPPPSSNETLKEPSKELKV
eukprot:TRINITY_DN1639_c0_g1_i5.p1 TRINITY_DN1639_c0_g1~~TRINITY_DN1639_c0_g1_i5.p1  ORF type:complete len:168 (-),score=40.70 TRINITY_DN1639_c0_g1_i5:280-783(-)